MCTKMLSLRWGGTSRVVAQRGSLYLLALTLLAASPYEIRRYHLTYEHRPRYKDVTMRDNEA